MKNCREYCPYTKICTEIYPNFAGEEGLSHNDCPMAWKIEDIISDQTPFCDKDFDMPEEDEEP